MVLEPSARLIGPGVGNLLGQVSQFCLGLSSADATGPQTGAPARRVLAEGPPSQGLEVEAAVDERVEAGVEDGRQEEGVLKNNI